MNRQMFFAGETGVAMFKGKIVGTLGNTLIYLYQCLCVNYGTRAESPLAWHTDWEQGEEASLALSKST